MSAGLKDPRTAQMLNMHLFVVQSTPHEGAAARATIFSEHLDYIIDLERRGLLFGSGPLVDETGRPTGTGLTILRAGSKQEAEAIAREDPYVKAGFRIPTISEWRLMEGSVSLKVDFSTGRFQLK